MFCVPSRAFCASFELLLELEAVGGKAVAGNGTCHAPLSHQCNPIPSAFPVCPMPEAVWWNQGCGCALSDNKKYTRLSQAGRIILENWRHLIAVLQTSKNYYKQHSVAINHFALILHLNESLETQHCTKFWSDRVDISRDFVADGHTPGFCCTPNPFPALQPFAGFTLGCISCMAGSEQQQIHRI